jgi:DNA-binding response OmpR family regulator
MAAAKKRVLVAEDNASLSQVICFAMARAGFEAVAARDGQEAWRIVSEGSIDLVITDQQMPLLSGVELCERIRRELNRRDLPILFCSAKGLELDTRRLREELGVAKVFFKPFSPLQMVATVRELLAAQPIPI